MAHFAKVENGIVVHIIVADKEFIDNHTDPSETWIQTSYNTHNNIHYNNDGEPDGGIALRGNYAGVGYTYDSVNDVFYPPKPHLNWLLDENTWTWVSPIPYPDDGKVYHWDEENGNWSSTKTLTQ